MCSRIHSTNHTESNYYMNPIIIPLPRGLTAVIEKPGNHYNIWWSDELVNEWVETYPTLSAALARAAVLAATDWDKEFTHWTPNSHMAAWQNYLQTALA